ncbi:hypothetical protein [Planotetraspora sp. GP83]
MTSIAQTVQAAGPRMLFVTVPWRPYQDGHRIEWKQPEADKFFAQLKGD